MSPSTINQGDHLDPDSIDDLLYYARTNDVKALDQFFDLYSTYNASHFSVAEHVLAALDGYTANNCAHLAAANGCMDMLCFLIGMRTPVKILHSGSEVYLQESQLAPSKFPIAGLVAQKLITASNQAGNTPLHYAAMNARLDAVTLLVKVLPSVHHTLELELLRGPSSTREGYVAVRNEAGRTAAEEAEAAGKDGFEAVVGFLEATAEASPNQDRDVNETAQAQDGERETGHDDDVEASAEDVAKMRVDG